MDLVDPGRVKTQKGRLRRGIAFYRRCEFPVVLLPVARTLRWRGRSFYAFLTLRRFRTAKTLMRREQCLLAATQHLSGCGHEVSEPITSNSGWIGTVAAVYDAVAG